MESDEAALHVTYIFSKYMQSKRLNFHLLAQMKI